MKVPESRGWGSQREGYSQGIPIKYQVAASSMMVNESVEENIPIQPQFHYKDQGMYILLIVIPTQFNLNIRRTEDI